MPSSSDPGPKREYQSTYFVQDRSNEQELQRIELQDKMTTIAMKGVLPEQADPHFQRILDVACGTGGWLIEAAKTYPTVTHLEGVDISHRMIDYARARAEAANVNDRVHFTTSDALQQLPFPSARFDLVNQRFALSFLRKWDWPKHLQELQRVTKRAGIVRLTEVQIIESTSSALDQLAELLMNSFYSAGHFFTQTRDGITSQLVPLLNQQGFQDVQTQAYEVQYRVGTEEGALFQDDIRYAYRTIEPFLRKWTKVPSNYDEIYQRALLEMQQPTFVATLRLLTAWGNNPTSAAVHTPIYSAE